jgi:hypothetical protein
MLTASLSLYFNQEFKTMPLVSLVDTGVAYQPPVLLKASADGTFVLFADFVIRKVGAIIALYGHGINAFSLA